MVKKKGSREMNPADAHRKAQRAKEIARNKKERKFQREAHALHTNPDQIKDELKEVLAMEEDGKVNQTIRLRKKALQGAYDHALKKRKEEELRQVQPSDTLSFSNQGGHGVLERRPEDSVYYHPTLNPSGVPPPGKPQRYKTSNAAPSGNNLLALPKPKPPPLPAGPAPQQAADEPGATPALPPPAGPPPGQPLPPPEGPPPGNEAVEAQASASGGPLPPPGGPPPGFRPSMMPPPMGAPPGMMPPPPGMPPSHMMRSALPPPNMPPPGFAMPPPPGRPPGVPGQQAKQSEHKDAKPIIQAASTVVKMPRADQDKTVTSMIPASLRVRREAAPAAKPRKSQLLSSAPSAAPQIGPDFGLAPTAPPPQILSQRRSTVGGASAFDEKYKDFMQEMAGLGALESN